MDDCLRYLRERTQLCPAYADCWNDLGLALTCSGEYAEAEAAFNEALGLNRWYLDARISLCFLYGSMGQSEKGFAEFRQILLESPDSVRTVFPLGIYCMRNGWKEAGLAQLQRAERMCPHSPIILAMGAAARHATGDKTAANKRMEKVTRLFRQLRLEGLTEKFQGVEVYSEWENPLLQRVHVLRANLLRGEGKVDEAEAEVLSANQAFPGYAPLMVAMGKLLIARDDMAEARKWLAAAILVDEFCDEAYYELSFLHAQNDDMPQSIRAARAAVSLRPLFPDYRYHLGTVLVDMGEAEAAVREFNHALVLNPSYGDCALQLVLVHLDQGRPEEALKVLASGVLDDRPEALVVAARAHLEVRQPQEARAKLQEALVQDASLTEAQEMLQTIDANG